jgi:hypothetical protein
VCPVHNARGEIKIPLSPKTTTYQPTHLSNFLPTYVLLFLPTYFLISCFLTTHLTYLLTISLKNHPLPTYLSPSHHFPTVSLLGFRSCPVFLPPKWLHLSISMVGRYHTPGSRAFDYCQGRWTLTHFSHGSFRQQSSIQAVANPVVNGLDQSCNMTPFILIDAQNYESRIYASVDENDIGTETFQIMILCWRLRAWEKTFHRWTGGKVLTNTVANHYSPRGPRAVLYLTTVGPPLFLLPVRLQGQLHCRYHPSFNICNIISLAHSRCSYGKSRT